MQLPRKLLHQNHHPPRNRIVPKMVPSIIDKQPSPSSKRLPPPKCQLNAVPKMRPTGSPSTTRDLAATVYKQLRPTFCALCFLDERITSSRLLIRADAGGLCPSESCPLRLIFPGDATKSHASSSLSTIEANVPSCKKAPPHLDLRSADITLDARTRAIPASPSWRSTQLSRDGWCHIVPHLEVRLFSAEAASSQLFYKAVYGIDTSLLRHLLRRISVAYHHTIRVVYFFKVQLPGTGKRQTFSEPSMEHMKGYAPVARARNGPHKSNTSQLFRNTCVL